ncbi:hypothetical protein ACFVRU_44050 [Streptomyces sp. NPDC057927]
MKLTHRPGSGTSAVVVDTLIAFANVLEHAGQARARVTLGHGQRGLTVSVMDDGEG